jgi:hypothetical protein
MARVIGITLLWLGVSACASDLLMPQWLLDARTREAEPMRTLAIRSADGFFRTSVPAKLHAPITLHEEAYLVQLDVGSTSPVECFAYRKGLDPAASLAMISGATFEALESSLGPIDFKRVERVDAGAMGGSPYLYAGWLYRVGGGADGFRIGEVKHLSTQKGGRSIHCIHNELGYDQTFRRVVAALVQSASYRTPLRARPYFVQVSTLTIDERKLGFEQTLLTRDAEGDTRVDVRTSLLVPDGRDELRTRDTVGVEFADAEGRLINQVHVENDDGELVTNIALDPVEGERWRVSGTYRGREIDTELDADSPPTSWLGEAFALRRTLAKQGVGSEISMMRWMPGADPKQLKDETLSIERRIEEDRYGAHFETDGREADLVVDSQGAIALGSVDLGFGEMGIERVYTRGKF